MGDSFSERYPLFLCGNTALAIAKTKFLYAGLLVVPLIRMTDLLGRPQGI